MEPAVGRRENARSHIGITRRCPSRNGARRRTAGKLITAPAGRPPALGRNGARRRTAGKLSLSILTSISTLCRNGARRRTAGKPVAGLGFGARWAAAMEPAVGRRENSSRISARLSRHDAACRERLPCQAVPGYPRLSCQAAISVLTCARALPGNGLIA
jgi:hypothetical protein